MTKVLTPEDVAAIRRRARAPHVLALCDTVDALREALRLTAEALHLRHPKSLGRDWRECRMHGCRRAAALLEPKEED